MVGAKTKNEDECIIKRGKLSLVDLAGSERANEANTRGDKLRDGASINKSLLALANCINALGRRRKVSDTQDKSTNHQRDRGNVHRKNHHPHLALKSSKRKPTTTVYVPYRDSKLTRLLKDGLSGKGKCVMIATVSEDAEQAINNANTLSYANRAKSIEMINPSHSSISTDSHHVSEMKKNGEYRKVVEALQSEVSRLKLALGNALENTNNGNSNSNSNSNNNNKKSNNSNKRVTSESTSSTTSSRLHGFFSRRNNNTKSNSINDTNVMSSTMKDNTPLNCSFTKYQNTETMSGSKHGLTIHDECKICSSRIALDERVLQLCDEITENVEERVNFQKALFELEAADMSNRRELTRLEKRFAVARGEEKVKHEKSIAKLRQQHLRHTEDSKKYANEISRNDSVRDLISERVDDLISGGGNYRGSIGLARSLSEYRLAVARNAELQFALALRDQTVAELRDEIESLRMRKTTNTFASSSIVSGIGDVDDNSSVSSFDDEDEDDEESEHGSTTSMHKRGGSKIPNITSLFSDDGIGNDENEDAWGEYDHHQSARKSTPTTNLSIKEGTKGAAHVASLASSGTGEVASSASSLSMQQAGCHGKQNSNANSLSARRRALAIERAALKAGNLSARGGPAKSASAVPSSSKYRDMIRDASLIFNRNRMVKTATSSSSTPISNNNTTVPKGSVKFNETRDRYRRKFG